MEYYNFSVNYWGYPIKFIAEYEIAMDVVVFTFYAECEDDNKLYKFPIKTFSRKKPFGNFDPDEHLKIPDPFLHKEAKKIQKRGPTRFSLLMKRKIMHT